MKLITLCILLGIALVALGGPAIEDNISRRGSKGKGKKGKAKGKGKGSKGEEKPGKYVK